MCIVYAIVQDSHGDILYNGARSATGSVAVTKKSALLGLAEYKSAVLVGKGDVSSRNQTGTCVCKEYDLIYGDKVSCDFRKKVVELAKELGLPQKNNEGANWLMAVMALETIYTFNPKAGTFKKRQNEEDKFTYVGLIQFGKAAASEVGTTRTQLLKMSAEEQLFYVGKYYKLSKFKDLLINKTALYLAVNYPVACKFSHDKNYVVYDSNKQAYDDNDLFKREAHEYKIEKDKKVYPDDVIGSSYVWEFEEAISEVAKKGENYKANDFSCICSEEI
jgi:hypothetical protein